MVGVYGLLDGMCPLRRPLAYFVGIFGRDGNAPQVLDYFDRRRIDIQGLMPFLFTSIGIMRSCDGDYCASKILRNCSSEFLRFCELPLESQSPTTSRRYTLADVFVHSITASIDRSITMSTLQLLPIPPPPNPSLQIIHSSSTYLYFHE